MPTKTVFTLSKRTVVGKKVEKVRTATVIPANIMGDLKESLSVEMHLPSFQKMFDKVGETGLVYLSVGDEAVERPVLINDIQRDPVSGKIIHVVFRQVDLTEKVTAEVPVEVVGVFEVKNAVLATLRSSITVSALPMDLPEKFEIDISNLTEVGQAITFADLGFDKSKVVLQIDESEMDSPVVMVQEVKEEVEEVVAAPIAVEGDAAAASSDSTAPAAADDAAKPTPKVQAKKE